ncbi:phage tail assembly chaperone [Paraurantiacibacter namhicola]|uniref:Phage tail assembly chaperone n=1 Tax=Paraurantiacibacter namhicola TaxID=645517 RepID=A0A1C7D570_9SPHN|nr:phage tail assembly chaperone [Paraurantiacibacter namhicola]ANU06599.1 hypothetical protein A6F65_00272 [Paraurantiacibacter namhicola]
MTGTFSDAAQRLAGLVPRALGWTPDQFWAATPEELAAIFSNETHAAPDQPLDRAGLQAMLERERHG